MTVSFKFQVTGIPAGYAAEIRRGDELLATITAENKSDVIIENAFWLEAGLTVTEIKLPEVEVVEEVVATPEPEAAPVAEIPATPADTTTETEA